MYRLKKSLGQHFLKDENICRKIVEELQKRRGNITAVTVRHHLTRLQEEQLITAPQLRHRSAPGRPQHVYMITEEAKEYFTKALATAKDPGGMSINLFVYKAIFLLMCGKVW